MPIFEYLCKKCDHRFETIVLGEKKRSKCPQCASRNLERQVEIFFHGGHSKRRRGVNSLDGIAHLRSLVGNIPTIPRYQAKDLATPKAARASR